MMSSVAVEGIWMWDVERSGKVERLLALASCNQQFLSHGLYAGVVRQLQVVDTGHDWGEEVVRVLCWLKRLPHDRQRWIQAPETWDTRWTPGVTFYNIQIRSNIILNVSPAFDVFDLIWVCVLGDLPPTGSLGLPVTNCRNSLCCSASKLLNTSNRNRTARLQKHGTSNVRITKKKKKPYFMVFDTK